MAKILTEKQLYKAKVEWFHDNEYEEVDPLAFYREIFPVGSFQDKGHTERKAGMVCSSIRMSMGNIGISLFLMI